MVDLSTLKGDGPKTAQILFKTDIDDAQIYRWKADGQLTGYRCAIWKAYVKGDSGWLR